MNKLGMHMMIYTAEWTEPAARQVFERAATFGYDLVEVLILDPTTTDTAMTARLADEYGVQVAAAICGTVRADLSSPDPDIASAGESLIAHGIELARDMGARMLGGPTFSAVHRYTEAPSESARERIVEAYARLADKGSAAGVRVGLEALNRYESNFINTVGQAAEVVRKVGSNALFVHGDLFHMNIEEGDLAAALDGVSDVLGYVHVAESNRGALGTGNTDWPGFFAALDAIGYDGPITFESFSPTVLGAEITNLVALWREPWTDPNQVARTGLAFLREHLTAASTGRA